MVNKWTKRMAVGCMTAAALAVLAGCGSNRPSDTSVLKLGATNFADSLEPTQNYFGWVVMRYGIGETLTKFDDTMTPQPWLATSWSVSPDKLTWTFVIRENVKFSNGDALTAEAVKESLERSFANNSRATSFFKYTNMTVEGNKLIITTDKPYPNMPGYLGDPLFIIVDVKAEKEGHNFAKEGPIATGPYVVKSFSKERTIVVKNDIYWDGKVPFARIEIPNIEDATTRALALDNGDVDVAVAISANDMGTFTDTKDFRVDEISSLRTILGKFNLRGPLGDPKVRDAVISGTDREAYSTALFKGAYIPGKAPIPPSLDYGFKELKDPNAYNPERSKQLLAEAGYKDTNGDGYVDKDGKNLELKTIVYTSRAELPMYAEAMQADMKKIGIKLDIESVEYSALDKIDQDGAYDILMLSLVTASTGDPASYLEWYWKTNADGSNPQNSSSYSNPRYDAIMNELETTFDKDKRRELIIEAQQILLNDGAALFLGYPKANMISRQWVTGAKISPTDYYWITKDIKPAE